jgi:UDP-N-acetylglucosamine enolpyruvyl transferase
MKAKILMSDPAKVVTFGPTEWRSGEIHSPNIIAAAKSLFVAALAGNGTTILHDSTDQLMRRYPDIVSNYKKLGAKVKKI